MAPHQTWMTCPKRSDVVFEFRSKKWRESDYLDRTVPCYVPYETLANLRGFQSVFGILKAQAVLNSRAGHTRGVDYPVYCDLLLVDFDNPKGEDDAFERYLIKQGYAHLRATSGGRSTHFHIPIVPIFGTGVPFSVVTWMDSHSTGHDRSFYHSNGNFRLLGTRHEKTGRYKVIVRQAQGKRLQIPLIEEPSDVWTSTGATSEVSALEDGLIQALSILGSEPGIGGRHIALFALAKSLRDAGACIEMANELGRLINERWVNQKSEKEILSAIRGGYEWRKAGDE